MKDQYFGDKRDYFKYDLAMFLAKNLPSIRLFTFIPMLTVNDKSRDGGKTDYPPAAGDSSLYTFLQDCIKGERRRVRELRSFFGQGDFRFEYCPYSDDTYFIHRERGPYFAGIPDDFLNRAVVLADPDNGLEVKTTRERHIRYDEIKSIYLRMSLESILAVFQYFPRFVRRKPYLEGRFQELQSILRCPLPFAISDNEIAFIIVAKSANHREKALTLVNAYAQRDDRLWVCS